MLQEHHISRAGKKNIPEQNSLIATTSKGHYRLFEYLRSSGSQAFQPPTGFFEYQSVWGPPELISSTWMWCHGWMWHQTGRDVTVMSELLHIYLVSSIVSVWLTTRKVCIAAWMPLTKVVEPSVQFQNSCTQVFVIPPPSWNEVTTTKGGALFENHCSKIAH